MRKILFITSMLLASSASFATTAVGTMEPKGSFTMDLSQMKQGSHLSCSFESTEMAWFIYSNTSIVVETVVKDNGIEKHIIQPYTMYKTFQFDTSVDKMPPNSSYVAMAITNSNEKFAIDYHCTLTP